MRLITHSADTQVNAALPPRVDVQEPGDSHEGFLDLELPFVPTGIGFIDWIRTLEGGQRMVCPLSQRLIMNPAGFSEFPEVRFEATYLQALMGRGQTSLRFQNIDLNIAAYRSFPNERLRREEVDLLREGYKELLCEKERKNLSLLVNDVTTVQEIPFLLEDRQPFNEIRCPLTKRPIRFAMTCDGSSEVGGSRPYYERAAIMAWCRLRPEMPPPGWPISHPFERGRLTVAHEKQRIINTALGVASRQLRDSLNDGQDRPVS